MIFDRKETPEPDACERCGGAVVFTGLDRWVDGELHHRRGHCSCTDCGERYDVDQQDFEEESGEWKRIERTIYSPWWRAAHNLLAHPLMAIHRPLGERLHEYTAERMYEYNAKYDPTLTDAD